MVEKKFPDFMWRYINEKYKEHGSELVPYLQPLKDIHIHYSSGSIKTNLYVFSVIALLILTLACINFINLSTARSAQRTKEVGLRKVLGAERGALIRQFLFESVFLSFFAFIIGLILAKLLSPLYKYLLNKNFSVLGSINFNQVLILAALVFFVGFASGFYPAIYMSSFKAARTVKGVIEPGRGKEKFRNILVVLQFSISIILIIWTIVINRNGDHPVIGVVKDFKYATLHHKIEPLIITNRPRGFTLNCLSLEIGTEDISGTLAALKKTWENLVPSLPLDVFFLDESIDNLYKSEEKFRGLFLGFSMLAIAIALLGLFSLASFSLELQSKEIGIRKVLGATKNSIFLVFSKQFFLLIVISNLIALPAAYVLTNNWLKNFAFREHISIWLFVFTIVGSLLMALLTISYQVLKASNKNPIEELKYE